MNSDKSSRETGQQPEQPADDPDHGNDFAYRDVNERLPNESLREELDSMTDEEKDAFLKRLEDLARTYIGPGGP